MDYLDKAALDRAERPFLEPREPQVIGTCYVCKDTVYKTDWYEYTYNGLRHCDCKPVEKENDL
jgi:hypothetical protein